jgi:hypothetical protein
VRRTDKSSGDAVKRSDRLSDMPPPEPVRELAAGWRRYQKIAPYRVKGPQKANRCASACSFLYVASIDRHGLVYVHRPRFGTKKTAGKADKNKRIDTDRTMTDTLEGMQRSEASIIALYRQMDAGEAILRLFERTSSATVTPALSERFPRYIADYLRDKCGGDAIGLERTEAAARAALAKNASNVRAEKALNEVRAKRNRVETCVAASHEAERLTQFAKYCPGGVCDRKAIGNAVRSKVNALRGKK